MILKSTIVVIALPILAVANPLAEVPSRRQFGQCNTGELLCCNQVESSYSNIGQSLLALLGLTAYAYGYIGLTCTPLSVIGLGGSSCSSQPVCCTNNDYNGVIALGCFPVNINL